MAVTVAWPTSLSPDSWDVLAKMISGTVPPTEEMCNVGWVAVGFGMGKCFAAGPLQASSVPMTTAAAVAHCHALKANANASLPSGMTWLQWVGLILQVLQAVGPILGGAKVDVVDADFGDDRKAT